MEKEERIFLSKGEECDESGIILYKKFMLTNIKGRGKVIPLQAHCGPEGG